MSAERLIAARLALTNLLEIYAPCNVGRTAALEALRGGVDEFEVAVREDEYARLTTEANNNGPAENLPAQLGDGANAPADVAQPAYSRDPAVAKSGNKRK